MADRSGAGHGPSGKRTLLCPIGLSNAVGLAPEASVVCLTAAFGPKGRFHRSPGQRPGYACTFSCALKGHFRRVDVPLQGTLTSLHVTQAVGLGYDDGAPLGLGTANAAREHGSSRPTSPRCERGLAWPSDHSPTPVRTRLVWVWEFNPTPLEHGIASLCSRSCHQICLRMEFNSRRRFAVVLG